MILKRLTHIGGDSGNGKLIFLSKEAKEKVSAMTDDDITHLSMFIAYSMRETQILLNEECKSALQEEDDKQ